MIKRIIHISNPSNLSLMLSQLVINQDGKDFQVPIEDIGVVILDEPMITISHPLLAKLAEEGISVITCDERHTPIGLHLPLYNHSTPSLYFKEQISLSKPIQKQLWQKIIQAKITGQADVLKRTGHDDAALRMLSENVKSGDTNNVEAQAARIYWQTLFGKDFIRERNGGYANPALNYGYALLRAAVARAVVGAGLCPMIGVFHGNQYNPFNLVDDLIEPLRPLVDDLVYKLMKEYDSLDPLTPTIKKSLCAVLSSNMIWSGKSFDLFVVLTYYCASFREGLKDSETFYIPKIEFLTK